MTPLARLIDSHQHFWSLATPGHEWPTAAEAAIHRDYGPPDLAAAARGLPLRTTILVQSQPTDTDTDWMLALAQDTAIVAGVVGWVDLAAADAPERIGRIAGTGKLRGLRPMLQSIADTEWLLRPQLEPALAAMREHGLRLDALIQPRHLTMLGRFVDRWPNLPIVIDHAAKPHAASGLLDPWRDEIAALAKRGLWCKLSGLRTEQAAGQSADLLQPYVDHLVTAFGDRLMWGSDWPVLEMAGDSYADWLTTADRMTALSGDARDRLFAGAAADFYALDGHRENRAGR